MEDDVPAYIRRDKRKRGSATVKPKSLNQLHAESDAASRAHPTHKINSSNQKGSLLSTGVANKGPPVVYNVNDLEKRCVQSGGIKSILRQPSKDCTLGGDRRNPIPVDSTTSNRFTRSSSRKVFFSEAANVVHNLDRYETVEDSEDDDDFVVTHARKKVLNLKEKQPNVTLKQECVTDEVQNVEDMEVDAIRTRTSPKTLQNIVNKLTPSQKLAIENMGLGTLLGLSIDGIPSKIGYFVVDHLNPETMQLEFEGKRIVLTEELVHRTIGLPNSGIDLDASPDGVHNQVLYRAWRSQFPKNKKIRPNDIVAKIQASGRGDDEFKVNFTVLFVNILCECSPVGCCYLSFLHKIRSVQMISKINWSRYVIDCNAGIDAGGLELADLIMGHAEQLRTHVVSENNRAEEVASVGGLKGSKTSCVRGKQPIRNLRSGFGNVNGPDTCNHCDEAQQINFSDRPRVHDVGQPSNNKNEDDILKKDYLIKIEEMFCIIYETKWDLEQLLAEALFLFPEESDFVHYNESREGLFRDSDPGHDRQSDNPETDPSSPKPCSPTEEPQHLICNNVESSHVTPKSDEPTEQQLPQSPIWYSQTTYNIIDDLFEHASAGSKAGSTNNCTEESKLETPVQNVGHEVAPVILETPTNESDIIPSFNLGFSPIRVTDLYKTDVKGKTKVAVTENMQPTEKRKPKIGLHLRSPYLCRPVVLGRGVRPIETRIHELCLTAFGGPDDMLYKSATEQRILRTPLETLAANEHIFTNVIDGWADVLNFEERYRSPVSPRRYFFKTNLMHGGVLLQDEYSFNERFAWFHMNLVQATNFNMDIINFRQIDMVFFPLLRNQHYFCVVFNLKTNTIDILDNMDRDLGIVDVYDFDIHILRQMVVQHLRNINHPSADLLEPVEDRWMDISWRTRHNFIDCGVFLMRHMETYMGGGVRGWYTGLSVEGPSQKRQIEHLRMMYCTKILLSDENTCKQQVEAELADLFSRSEIDRMQLKQQAEISRSYRVNIY
ncbi:hypothetical protein OSB04_002144 [Centaurea solstitialis]|uniref:Ubiquitin-like protease family profile domain-containing protein n=1 Tax=Centaurea solstitialis TaxID=347529 RepID=A0AA38TZX2_9ASTR|nr:hypothetical protein OSB04_002144 [Centaurea solstitialis]